MTLPTQEHRFASIETPLGQDRLLLRYCNGREELGRIFEYGLTLLDALQDLDPDSLIGLNATVRIQLETGEEDQARYINGFITSLSFLGYQDGAGVYHARLVPWLWLLTRTSDCRSFQDRTVPQILEEVFTDFGFKDFRFDLTAQHQPKTFCVQYNETAFNFVSRVMENEGIYYWWEHTNGKHTMVITDSATTHPVNPVRPEIEWRPRTGVKEDGYLYGMRLQKTVSPGGFHLNDYNFKTPSEDLRAQRSERKRHAAANFEHFEYPGLYREAGGGDRLSAIRLEEAQTNHETIDAEVTARAMAAGYKFQLTRAERPDQERQYLIVSSSLSVTIDAYAATGGAGGNHFEGSISALPLGVAFRPARVTPKPVISGPQPGLIVGPPGEEIHCDAHGRVKVHFYWDRRSEADEKSSKWVRVSQASAGSDYGFMSLPRVGQEVLVEFMNGDPDQPIITGRVYNGENKHPYDPESLKTRSSWKTNTYPGGGGFNELRFEDAKGKEQIFIHGQKLMDSRVLDKSREWVGVSKHVIVGKESRESTGEDKHEIVGRHLVEEVGGDRSHVTGGQSVSAVSKDAQLFVNQSALLVSGKHVNLQAAGDVTMISSKKVVIEAPSITLDAGNGNFITIDGSGVRLVGQDIFLNCGGNAMNGTSQPYWSPDEPKKPETASDAPSGKVEKAKGMHHTATADQYPAQTVSDIAANEGTPFMEEPAPASGLDPLAAAGFASGLPDLLQPVKEGADELRDLLREAVGFVKEATGAMTGALQDATATVKGLVQDVTNPIKEAAGALRDAVHEVQSAVKEVETEVKTARDAVKDALKDAAREVTEPLKETVKAVHEAAREVKETAQEVKELAATTQEAVKETAAAAKEAVSSAVKEAVAPVKEAAGALKGAAQEIRGVSTAVRQAATESQAALKEAVEPIRQVQAGVKEAGKAIRQATGGLRKSLGGLLG